MELMGIPHRIVIGDRGLKGGTLEYKGRRDTDNQDIAIGDMLDFIQNNIKKA
jgi:prolyl-tRNA synthetase